MKYGEKIALCSQTLTKHINTLGGQNVEFVNVNPLGFYGLVLSFSLISSFHFFQKRFISKITICFIL